MRSPAIASRYQFDSEAAFHSAAPMRHSLWSPPSLPAWCKQSAQPRKHSDPFISARRLLIPPIGRFASHCLSFAIFLQASRSRTKTSGPFGLDMDWSRGTSLTFWENSRGMQSFAERRCRGTSSKINRINPPLRRWGPEKWTCSTRVARTKTTVFEDGCRLTAPASDSKEAELNP